MKKSFVFVAIATAFLAISCGTSKKTAVSQTPAAPVSASAQRAVELKSKGYSVTGSMSTFTLESLLELHNSKILSNPDRYCPVQGSSEGMGMLDFSSSKLAALNDAAVHYATEAGSVVSGGMSRQFSNLSSESRTKLMGAYTQKVQEYIMPYMKESLSVYRQNGREFEVVSYFLIDEEKAVNVRKQSMDEALKEAAVEQVFGNAVDEWVKKFVRVD